MPTKVALVALAVAATTTLSACQNAETATTQPAASSAPTTNGVAALSADEILQRATAALTAAKYYHYQGEVKQGGRPTAIDVTVSGTDFTGSMSFGKARVDLLSTGGEKYVRLNEQFWAEALDAKRGHTMATVIGDRWVTGVKNDKSFAEMFSVGSAEQLLKPDGPLAKGPEKTVDGVPAIGINDTDHPGSVLYVATTGEPYPLRVVEGGDALMFSGFGVPSAQIKAPAAGQIVDLGALARR